MRLATLGFVIALLLTGCGPYRVERDRETIRDGLLTLNLRQAAFLEEWGKLDRTRNRQGKEMMRAGWGSGGGSFFKGQQTLEVWVYEKKKTELVFTERKVLAGWKSDATVKELSTQSR